MKVIENHILPFTLKLGYRHGNSEITETYLKHRYGIYPD